MNTWFQKGVASTVVCDPGIDDLLALRLLEKLSQNRRGIIVPTYGNMPKAVTTRTAQRYADVSSYGWVIADSQDDETLIDSWIDDRQGTDGLWNTTAEPVVSELEQADSTTLSTQLVSLGTLGPVRRMMQAGIAERVLVMGGVFERMKENGNDAELNIRLNIPAARWVFDNADTSSVWLVPADVAFGTAWSLQTVKSIPSSNTINSWLKTVLLRNYESGRYGEENELYDPIAVFLGFYPSYATWRRSGVRVSEDGQTFFDSTKPAVWVATDIPNRAQVAAILFRLLFETEDYNEQI